jgi:tetratricopeptide (TPR) repeat protein
MNRSLFLLLFIVSLLMACDSTNNQTNTRQAETPDLPQQAQAISLLGQDLIPPEPSLEMTKKLAQAQKDFEADPQNADNVIWLGRRTAYTGQYREAIRIYTEGIETFPNDARFYRHRGHRYISVREFDKAIDDLRMAVELSEGQKDQIEPDGLPNAQNIPLTTLKGNIWYHLGLAYYLKGDFEDAIDAFTHGLYLGNNADNYVSTTHWLYMSHRRMGYEGSAGQTLIEISPGMLVVENFAYHRLCLFYKGELQEVELLDGLEGSAYDAALYGLGNWYYYNGDEGKAQEHFNNLLASKNWSSFGYIAAEVDMARMGR